MKKAFKWLGICMGSIIFLIILAGALIMLIVDKEMIASAMEEALHRHVTLKELNVGIFAIASGIEVKDVKISNFKTEKQLTGLKGKPVQDNDLFVGLKAFNFKIQFMPLLSGNFVLKELALYEPKINVVKYKNGEFNFDDLLKPATEAEKKKTDEKKEPEKKVVNAKEEPAAPFTVDNIPIAITIGKIGMENAELTFEDKGLEQTFKVYNLTALIHSIKIDAKDIENKNSAGLKVEMGVKTIGTVKSGSVQSFDIGFKIEGNIIPFDKKTRIANPEITLKAGLPYGTMTGLQIFEKMKSIEQLAKYCGKLSFLKKDIVWKNAFVNVWYKDNIVKLKDGKIPTEDYELAYAGQTNLKTKDVNLDMDMLLADKHGKSIRSGIEENIKKGIQGNLKKYVKPEKITDIAMKRITNKDGKALLKYQVTGPMNDPNTKLVYPELPSIKELIKGSAGDLADMAKDKAKEMANQVKDKAKAEADKKAEEEKKKAEQKTRDELKKRTGGKLPF